jgi:hypothetical protein
MTARLRARRSEGGRLVLVSKVRKRLSFAATFAILAVALVMNLDPARDFAPTRAPLTVLYGLVLAATLHQALSDEILTADGAGRVVRRDRRLAGHIVRRSEYALPPSAEVRLRREGRGPYVLEMDTTDGVVPVDTSSWRTELEPIGRDLAAALGLVFRGAEGSPGVVDPAR